MAKQVYHREAGKTLIASFRTQQAGKRGLPGGDVPSRGRGNGSLGVLAARRIRGLCARKQPATRGVAFFDRRVGRKSRRSSARGKCAFKALRGKPMTWA